MIHIAYYIPSPGNRSCAAAKGDSHRSGFMLFHLFLASQENGQCSSIAPMPFAHLCAAF